MIISFRFKWPMVSFFGEQWTQLQRELADVHQTDQKDRLVWQLTSYGVLTVKSL